MTARITKSLTSLTAKKVRYYRTIALVAIVMVLSGIAIGELDVVLRGMHAPGKPSYGMDVLAGSLTEWGPRDRETHVADALSVWDEHPNTFRDLGVRYTSGKALVVWHALIDTFLFLPTYILLFGLVTWRLIRHARPPGTGPSRSVTDLIYRISPTLLLVVALADLVENGLEIAVVFFPELMLLYALKLMWLSKWLGVALLALLLFAALMTHIASRVTSVGREVAIGHQLSTIRVLRVPLFLVLAFGGFLLVPEQSWDVPRRWGPSTSLVVIGLAILTRSSTGRWHTGLRCGVGR